MLQSDCQNAHQPIPILRRISFSWLRLVLATCPRYFHPRLQAYDWLSWKWMFLRIRLTSVSLSWCSFITTRESVQSAANENSVCGCFLELRCKTMSSAHWSGWSILHLVVSLTPSTQISQIPLRQAVQESGDMMSVCPTFFLKRNFPFSMKECRSFAFLVFVLKQLNFIKCSTSRCFEASQEVPLFNLVWCRDFSALNRNLETLSISRSKFAPLF